MIRRVINERRLRLWVAGTYALLPVLLGGTNQGRLGLSVVAIGLPLLVSAVRALVLRRVGIPEAWRGGWGAGVVLVALVAFEPSLIIPAMLLGVLGAVVLRRTPRKIGRIGIALGSAAGRAGALVAERDRGSPAGSSSGRTPRWAAHRRPPRPGRCCSGGRRAPGCRRCGSAP